jgi:hypothetical protein
MNSATQETRSTLNLVKAKSRPLLKAVAMLTALVAVVTLGSSRPAFSQDGHQAERASQKPDGSWLYTVTIPNPDGAPIVFLGTETYAGDGGYSEHDQLSFTPGYLATGGHGVWRSTGNDEFVLTYMNLTYDATGTATGSGKVRQTTKISRDGKSYSGSGDFFYYDEAGNTVASGTFTITAKRILVERPE